MLLYWPFFTRRLGREDGRYFVFAIVEKKMCSVSINIFFRIICNDKFYGSVFNYSVRVRATRAYQGGSCSLLSKQIFLVFHCSLKDIVDFCDPCSFKYQKHIFVPVFSALFSFCSQLFYGHVSLFSTIGSPQQHLYY